MPKVTYVEFNGTAHQVDVPIGTSVMRGAVDNNIPGIDADCGGECACATCHVYVDEDWLRVTGTPAPGSQEASMLSLLRWRGPIRAFLVRSRSRKRSMAWSFACQKGS